MRSVGILLFNSKGELLGPEAGSGYLSIQIQLEGPFSKTWKDNVTAFKLPPFNNLFYSYSELRDACWTSLRGLCSRPACRGVDGTAKPVRPLEHHGYFSWKEVPARVQRDVTGKRGACKTP